MVNFTTDYVSRRRVDLRTGLRYAMIFLELWDGIKDSITNLKIRDLRGKVKICVRIRWKSASTAMARGAVPGAERFGFLRLEGIYPLIQT